MPGRTRRSPRADRASAESTSHLRPEPRAARSSGPIRHEARLDKVQRRFLDAVGGAWERAARAGGRGAPRVREPGAARSSGPIRHEARLDKVQRRFLDAVGVAWERASRAEARDFSCWIQLTVKQRLQTSRPEAARWSSRAPGAPNPVTGKRAPGDGYAPAPRPNPN